MSSLRGKRSPSSPLSTNSDSPTAVDMLAGDMKSRLHLTTKTVGADRIRKARENNEDIAVLSMFLPGSAAKEENARFRCTLGYDCRLGDARLATPGIIYINISIWTMQWHKIVQGTLKTPIYSLNRIAHINSIHFINKHERERETELDIVLHKAFRIWWALARNWTNKCIKRSSFASRSEQTHSTHQVYPHLRTTKKQTEYLCARGWFENCCICQNTSTNYYQTCKKCIRFGWRFWTALRFECQDSQVCVYFNIISLEPKLRNMLTSSETPSQTLAVTTNLYIHICQYHKYV